MKKLFLTLALLFSFVSSAFALTYDEALGQGKAVVILFKMQYCSACKAFEPTFDAVASKLSNRFSFVKEDASHSDLANSLNIRYVPAVFIINPTTKAAYKIDDANIMNASGFEKALNNYNVQ